jgi:hypothetical protein
MTGWNGISTNINLLFPIQKHFFNWHLVLQEQRLTARLNWACSRSHRQMGRLAVPIHVRVPLKGIRKNNSTIILCRNYARCWECNCKVLKDERFILYLMFWGILYNTGVVWWWKAISWYVHFCKFFNKGWNKFLVVSSARKNMTCAN